MRTCTRCHVEKPEGDFSLKKRGEPALKSVCKACTAADTRARYAADPGPRLEYAKVSRKDPAVRRQINDRRNLARRSNPELELWRLAKHRARVLGVAFDIDVTDLAVPDVCPVLGIELRWGGRQMSASPTVDRLLPECGYTKGNVRVISWKANRIKSDASLGELVAVARYVADHLGASRRMLQTMLKAPDVSTAMDAMRPLARRLA